MLYTVVEIRRKDQKMSLIGFIVDHDLLWLMICIACFGINVVFLGGNFVRYFKAMFSFDVFGAGAEFGNMAGKMPILITLGLIGTISGLLFVIAIVVDILVYVKLI